MFIFRTFSIFLLTNPITAKIKDFKKTGTQPEVTPFNETHVEIDYRESVIISDISQIKEIEARKRNSEKTRLRLVDNKNNILDRKPILVEVDVCQNVSGELRFENRAENGESIDFAYSPLSYLESTYKSEICSEDQDNMITVTESETNTFRKCPPKIYYHSGENYKILKSGRNSNALKNKTLKKDFKIEVRGQERTFSMELMSCPEGDVSSALLVGIPCLVVVVLIVILVFIFRSKKRSNTQTRVVVEKNLDYGVSFDDREGGDLIVDNNDFY